MSFFPQLSSVKILVGNFPNTGLVDMYPQLMDYDHPQ